MKRLLLIIIFLVLDGGPAIAEWAEVGFSKSYGGYTVYADPSTIRHRSGLAKMWALYNYMTVRTDAGVSYLSRRTQQQYDCAGARYRFLSETYFSGDMGRGDEVYTNSYERKWEPVAPASVGHALWELACGKK
jgi:hypothetical protein